MSLAIPYRDHSRTPQAFVLSVLLHALLAGALAAFFLTHPATKPISSHVIELVAGPPATDTANDEPASNSSEAPLTVSNLSSPEASKPTDAVPQTTESTQTTPQQSPKTVVTRGPGPRANPQAKIVPYSEWLKEHPSTTRSTRGATTPIPHVGIDPGVIANRLQQWGNRATRGGHAGPATTGENGSSDDYDNKLIQSVYAVFAPPQGYAGLSAGIRLVIAPDGSVTEKQLTRSSGNDIFDNAVRLALERLTNVEPPPEHEQIIRDFILVPKTT